MTKTARFKWFDYLALKFWPVWIGLAILRSIVFLPFRLQLFIGKMIGYFFYHLAPKYRREIAAANIALCFPNLSQTEQQDLVLQHFYSLGMSIVETALTWWASEKKLRSLVSFKGVEYIQDALNAGKGAILLGAHYTTVDISGRLLTLDNKVAISYQPYKNKLLDAITLHCRKKFLDRVFDRHEIRQTFRYIKQNNLMWIAADQDANVDQSIFVPFFGNSASTQTVPSRVAKITGASVIPYVSRRLKNAQGYEIEFYPPLDNFPSESVEEDIIRVNKVLEDMIKQIPEQYLWVHRRFKTRPEGMPSLYPEKHKKQ